MKLYHYTSLDTAIRKILPYMQLKFSKVSNMNDVTENLYYLTEFANNIFISKVFFDGIQAKYFQNEWQLLCFSTNYRQFYGYQNQRMWAQYGSNNKGICLEIDFDKFIDLNKSKIKKYSIVRNKVKYSNKVDRRLIKEEDLPPLHNGLNRVPMDFRETALNLEKLKNRFFTKDVSWRDEHEYRFAINTSDEIYMSINDCIDTIYLGPLFPKEYLSTIKKHLDHINIKGLRIDAYGQLYPEDVPNNLWVK